MKKNGEKTQNLISNKKKYNTYDLSGEFGVGYTSNGEEFYFDLEDYGKIKNYCWSINQNGYVSNSNFDILMHILIMDAKEPFYVDHIKHNKADNRKKYLRLVTPSQSAINRKKQSNNTSGVTGVYFHKHSGKWVAYIKLHGEQIRKYGKNKEDAIRLRKQMEEEYFGEYSYNNSMKYVEEEI